MLGTETKERMRLFYEDIKKHPEQLCFDFKMYDYTREEAMQKWWEKYNFVASLDRKRYFDDCPDE